jgi:hypothetical protein
MSLVAHIEELSEKHRNLQRQIETEMTRPLIDSLKVAELKKRKLYLKDRIERLRAGQAVA